jgi:hypothetical protein
VLASVTLTSAGVAVAVAQTAAKPTGDFGGGAIAVPVDEDTVAKDMLLSIRARSNGEIGVDGQMFGSCAVGTIKGSTRLAADGRFRLTGSATRRPVVGVSERTSFTVAGRLTAEGGQGTAKMRVRVRRKGRATKLCESRTVRWTVGQAGGPSPAAPAPAARATLFGMTSQNGPRAKRAVVLHAANGGRAIERFTFSFRTSCDKRRIVVTEDLNVTPEFDVAADGSFSETERFRATFSDVIVRTTVVVDGRFDVGGGASGTVSVIENYTNARNGKRVDSCETGTLAWSARP